MTESTWTHRLTDPDPAVLRLLDDPDEVTARILTAAVEQMATVGWRRSTMEDVAKRAKVGRATVYRKFPNKTVLTDAVLHDELRKYLAGSTAAVAGRTDIAERLAESAAYTTEYLREHRLLRRLLDTEPDTALPGLTLDAGPIIGLFREFCVALWKHELYGDTPISDHTEQHLRTVAELHIRIALSLLLTTDTAIALDTTDQAREFARHYLAPMLTTPPDQPE
ncbi:TetR/AcrR family transcriptional regulator [Nocardia otitidiscaviarum]|uniref:TetR/AcrR family transcriptional regulator n=1 Tax=Nocardia otitidiscaviarum TaxID=1823 RepID=A0A516NP36_9NOCA|nr:TetR/AcrR family transcriptional regulator [Nocardia otitidiscaviarum]MCP9624072.1 TetR/AcrR family transcriptional regulator [Nocardia otitidiscaviarum]QDP80670.1 TetR/AcrR family transcriptional regulator [Nocardia otitidiscaviarum]